MRRRTIFILSLSLALCLSMCTSVFGATTYQGAYKGSSLAYSTKVVSTDYYYQKKTNTTYVTTTTEITWKKAPGQKGTDIIAVGNGDGFIVKEKNKCKTSKKGTVCTQYPNSTIKVTYVPCNSTVYGTKGFTKTNTVKPIWASDSGTGIYYRVPLSTTKGFFAVPYYAKKITITVRWEKKGKDTDACFGSRYGHNYYTVNPSASISGKGPSFSFSFTKVKETKPVARVRVKNPIIK